MLETQANIPIEITFTAVTPYADPFHDVTLDLLCTDPTGIVRRVPAFWAGGNAWKARYASPLSGMYTYRSECSMTADSGLHGIEGRIEIAPYKGDNPLYRHGPIRVADDKRHFAYAD